MRRHLLVPLAALSAAIYGQKSSQPPPTIVGKAELLTALKSPTLKPGDLFYLHTTTAWHQGNCTVPSHITITGHVESLTPSPAGTHDTTLALRFSEVPCTESQSRLMTPLLLAIEDYDSANYDTTTAPLLTGVFSPDGFANIISKDMAKGVVATDTPDALANALDASQLSQPRTEKPMKAGEVRGYRGVALIIPGPDDPVAKLTSKHKIVLYRTTEFAFAYVPTSSAGAEVTAANPPPAAITAPVIHPPPAPPTDPPPAPPPAEIEDVCISSGCKELSAVADPNTARALWSLPLVDLGYQPRPTQLIIGLDSSAGVHFLGEDQILLTFTRHVLLPHSSDADAWASNPRSVRGVLISRADGHVLRVKDWIVSDDIGPFIWSLDNGIVIAHVGHDLVRFGPGLSIEQRFQLPGPLLLLSASPRGNLLLAVTVHEKHTQKEHAQLAKLIGSEDLIDEEYDLTGLSDAFQVTGVRRVTVKPLRLALLQNSTVSARSLPGMEWLLEQSTWAGQTRRFAHFRSSCPLQIQSFPGDLLFIQGCMQVGANTWYRVLNSQGATLFKGSGPFSDFIQQAESTSDGRLFAIALSHFKNRPVDRTTQLQIQDFTNLTVTVYDTATGKQFFAAHPPHGSAQSDTFSLSASGSALAVLTSTSLQLFPLPTPATRK